MRLIGSVSLVGILALAIVGMDWVTRVQKILLVLLIFSQLDFVIGTFLTPSPEEHAKVGVGEVVEVLHECGGGVCVCVQGTMV